MKKKYIVILCVSILVIAIDLVTKIFSHNWHDVVLIDGILSLNYVENSGAAFSMFSENKGWLLVISTLMVACMFVYDLFSHHDHVLYNVSFAFIIGGAIGNLIDRIFLGYVRDFIQPDFVDFATFNIADSFLTVGAIMFMVFVIFFNKKSAK